MSETLVFMMGAYTAPFPTDRRYATNHMWAQAHCGGWRFGLTAYAVRLLQDVYFLDWGVQAGTELAVGHEIGVIESSKAESSLYAPITGWLTELNARVLADPSIINGDNYGTAWLLHMTGRGDTLLGPEQYLTHLDKVWAVAQRTLKGQWNR